MRRRFAMVAAAVLMSALPAHAAVRTVTMGNFYFDDATPGDGRVVVDVGDQIRFVVRDGGPGTPHTVEIDFFGIHSGGLAAGETYTTPPLNTPGTYRLYCKPHARRGHEATLVVQGTAGTAPTPTTSSTATARPGKTATARPSVAPSASSTAQPSEAASSSPTEPQPSVAGSGSPESATTEETGRGRATRDELAVPRPPDPLEIALGRAPAKPGPWTRSVRLGALLLLPLAGFAALARRRYMRATLAGGSSS